VYFSTRYKISANRPNDRPWMAELGRLATGERRHLHILTKRQDVGANDWPRMARLVLRKARMAERGA
jgi:hypothetical protein